MRWALLAGFGVAACGRFGFDAAAPGTGGETTPDADGAAQPLVTCNQPTMIGQVSGLNHRVEIAGTPSGFVAITTDDTHGVRAWTASVAPDGRITAGGGVQIGAVSNGLLAIAPSHTGLLVAGGYATGTYLQAVMADGSVPGAPRDRAGDTAAEGPLAASGTDGTLAFATVAGTGEIDARLVDVTGADLGPAVTIVDAAVGAGEFHIAAAGTGYAATWTDPNGTPNAKRVALLGPDLSVVAGPVTANTSPFGAENGEVAWAAESHTYLVTWQDKSDSGSDQVNIRLYDANLHPLAAQSQQIMSGTGHPRVASDGTGYFITAENYDSRVIVVRYVSPTGDVTAVDLTQNGDPEVWATAGRAGQSISAWVSGTIWVDVPCKP